MEQPKIRLELTPWRKEGDKDGSGVMIDEDTKTNGSPNDAHQSLNPFKPSPSLQRLNENQLDILSYSSQKNNRIF